MTNQCCEKCYSIYTEHDYPAHTEHDACINQNCDCHTHPLLKSLEEEAEYLIKVNFDGLMGHALGKSELEAKVENVYLLLLRKAVKTGVEMAIGELPEKINAEANPYMKMAKLIDNGESLIAHQNGFNSCLDETKAKLENIKERL